MPTGYPQLLKRLYTDVCTVCFANLTGGARHKSTALCVDCVVDLELLTNGVEDSLPRLVAKRNHGARTLRGGTPVTIEAHRRAADRGAPPGWFKVPNPDQRDG